MMKSCEDEKFWRFWSRVIQTEGCWKWKGQKDKDGYGALSSGVCNEHRAHRISYRIHKGDIPEGMFVLHRCDTPECTNPNHLFLGTQLDNNHDMIAKGRAIYVKGIDNGAAKLSDNIVRDIKRRYPNGRWKHGHPDNQMNLAKEFGINQAQISRIIMDKAWDHVA